MQICFIEGDGRPIYIYIYVIDVITTCFIGFRSCYFVCFIALFLPRKYKMLADGTVSSRHEYWIYIYICMYVCRYVHMCVKYVCVCMYVCAYVCLYVCVCVCVCVWCMYVCVGMYLCMYVCMHVCMYEPMLVRITCLQACAFSFFCNPLRVRWHRILWNQFCVRVPALLHVANHTSN